MTIRKIKKTGSFAHVYTFVNEDDVAINLSGFTVTASGKMKRDSSVTFDFGIVETDLTNGQVTITLTPTQSNALEVTQYLFDVKALSASGLTSYIIDTEQLDVLDNCTEL